MFEMRKIRKKLGDCQIPGLQQDVVSANAITDLQIDDDNVRIKIDVNFPLTPRAKTELAESMQRALADYKVDATLTTRVTRHVCQPHVQLIPAIKNIIAISSGKGGVGKSTTAVNIALALKQAGARVGLLDADIYGPNQPHMLGIEGEPEIVDEKFMVPIERYGLQTISMGNLIKVDSPAVWRGPMVTKALQQLVFQTKWERLDYLIIDMPPGTGDIQLTLAKQVPVSGAVVITTPQDIALIDARKGLEMFRKASINLLGIVENMSGFECGHCGEHTPLFGEVGGESLAKATGVPLLGKIPLSIAIRKDVDQGLPSVEANPNSEIASCYQNIAMRIAALLSLTPVVQEIGKPTYVD
jgi:ATP-binding protein involved in chromosome partitioning